MDRHAAAAHLQEIADLLLLRGGNRFKARAFARGARALAATKVPLETLIAEGRLTAIPGIGVAIAKQVEELHRDGRSSVLAALRDGLPSGVLELAEVAGIGLHALESLHAELGVATLGDLREAAASGRLRAVKGFGPKKEAKILAAIARYESTPTRLPLAEGLRLADAVADDLDRHQVELAGSLRRSVELAGDLDLVVAGDEPIAAATALARVAAVESRDGASARLRLVDGTRIDVFGARPEELATTLLFATGPRAHVDRLVLRAAERGMRLTKEGLFREAARVPTANEDALYTELGLAFVPPELRDDDGAIEQAERGPLDLVREVDLGGFVHCHTTWSDGKNSIEEMARAAEARGAAYLTITDHSAAAHYAGGLDEEKLARQWDEIAAVQERVNIKILRGTEADILADGALDWPDRVLERFDVVVASIHARHKMDEDAMTARVLRALRHPIFKIWGHPLGRLVPSRPPIPCRVEEVLDALAASRGAIEINGDPHRLDLEPRWSRAARARGIPFVLSVDAHATRELGNVRYASGLARRAGVRRSEVLNALDADAFAQAVRPVQ